MKKIFVVLLLSLLSVQQMSAQKWLKVLGEVASAVLSDDNASVQTKAIPNCIVKFTACEANGNDVTISFTVENQTGKEFRDETSCYGYKSLTREFYNGGFPLKV